MQATSVVDLLSASLSSAAAATVLIGVPVEGTPSVNCEHGAHEGGGDANSASSHEVVFATASTGAGVLLLALIFAFACYRRRKQATKIQASMIPAHV